MERMIRTGKRFEDCVGNGIVGKMFIDSTGSSNGFSYTVKAMDGDLVTLDVYYPEYNARLKIVSLSSNIAHDLEVVPEAVEKRESEHASA